MGWAIVSGLHPNRSYASRLKEPISRLIQRAFRWLEADLEHQPTRPGLGILQVRKRPARMGRNPATGEAIKIKASKKIAFRASKDLKELVM